MAFRGRSPMRSPVSEARPRLRERLPLDSDRPALAIRRFPATFADMDPAEARSHTPSWCALDGDNRQLPTSPRNARPSARFTPQSRGEALGHPTSPCVGGGPDGRSPSLNRPVVGGDSKDLFGYSDVVMRWSLLECDEGAVRGCSLCFTLLPRARRSSQARNSRSPRFTDDEKTTSTARSSTEVLTTKSCGSGDPAQGDASGGCHANVTSFKLTTVMPVACGSAGAHGRHLGRLAKQLPICPERNVARHREHSPFGVPPTQKISSYPRQVFAPDRPKPKSSRTGRTRNTPPMGPPNVAATPRSGRAEQWRDIPLLALHRVLSDRPHPYTRLPGRRLSLNWAKKKP